MLNYSFSCLKCPSFFKISSKAVVLSLHHIDHLLSWRCPSFLHYPSRCQRVYWMHYLTDVQEPEPWRRDEQILSFLLPKTGFGNRSSLHAQRFQKLLYLPLQRDDLSIHLIKIPANCLKLYCAWRLSVLISMSSCILQGIWMNTKELV